MLDPGINKPGQRAIYMASMTQGIKLETKELVLFRQGTSNWVFNTGDHFSLDLIPVIVENSEDVDFQQKLSPVKTKSPPINETKISIKTHADFFQSLTITSEERRIIFDASEQEIGKISVYFPAFCVLGERKVNFEIIQLSSIFNAKNEKFITPVLYIAQPKHTPFLRRVKITLPLNKLYDPDSVLDSSNLERNISIDESGTYCVIEAHSFSPVAALQETSINPNQKSVSTNEKKLTKPVQCSKQFDLDILENQG